MAAASSNLPPLTTQDSRSSISARSMHEVDPSPVDDDDQPNNEKLPLPVTSSSSSSSSTNFLGLTPHRTVSILQAIQKYAVVPPTIYLSMHYSNTALIPLFTQSARESDKYLLLTRPYYQSFPLEPLLIFLPIISHVASGVALRIYRRRIIAKRHGAETYSQRKTIPWPKLSLTSALGYIMYPLFAGHVLTQRITPKNIEGSSAGVGLRFFAHGVAHDPWITSIGYSAFVSIASFHFVTGATKFLRLSGEYISQGGDEGRKRRKWRNRLINGVAAGLAAGWIAGGLGVIGRSGPGTGWEATQWDKIYRAMPLIGKFFE